ncbi:hypothetical protein Leryth_006281 [Lithospermum erythrorhizon]|nr:hypothetical protein Leryth_006281 [Lithospermum erythrorhizon]
MVIDQYKDVENGVVHGVEELGIPFLENFKKVDDYEGEVDNAVEKGSIVMVLLSTFVAVCGSFEFGFCVGYSAPTQFAIRNELDLSLAEFSMFGSIITIGAMVGAVSSGSIADFVGRKGAMRMSACFCTIGWLAVYFSMAAWTLDVGRFFTGYGIGILSYVVPVFIAEIAPQNLRGGLTTINQLLIVCGASASYLVGIVVTWRTLSLIGVIPCVFLLVGLVCIPESPRWLAKVGLSKEFQAELRKLRGKDADITQEAAEIQAYVDTLQSLPKAKFMDLFGSKYIRSVIIGVGLMALQQLVGINGINFYATEIFVAAGLSGNEGTIAYAIIQLPITVVGATLMDKSGRRALIMVAASGIFLGCFLTGGSFFLKEHGLLLEWVPLIAISGVLIYISSFSIGMGGVPWVIMSEIFPIHVKGVAGSFVVLVNWLCAWIVSFTFNFLLTWSSTSTFSIFAGFSIVTILFVAKVVPETKGKTLEQIQVLINS